MADITKVKVTLNTGVAVGLESPDDSVLSVVTVGPDLVIANSGGQTIASFSKSAVAYWTTDLAEIS